MDEQELRNVTTLFRRVTEIALNDPETAQQVRDAIAESGLFDVFGKGGALDVVDLLDASGEDALRAHLGTLSLADLRQIVAAHNYDPEKQSARWRSTAKFIDLIVTNAQQQLEKEQAEQANDPNTSAVAWML